MAVLALIAAAVIGVTLLQADDDTALRPGEPPSGERSSDPFAYDSDQREDFERRATTGLSHVLFAKSPGGVIASAERTAQWREQIEDAADHAGIDPDLLEAMIFLESGGRAQVIAGGDPTGAAGLAQIVASTGKELLGMRIQLERSRRLSSRIRKLELRAQQSALGRRAERRRRRAERRLPRLREKRARIDERFDPDKALAAAGLYLRRARRGFGLQDLAVESYHMGISNLAGVIRTYLGADERQPIDELVAQNDLSYAQLYFDSSPLRHRDTYELLSGFGDDSSTYYWRVLAAREIMRLWRQDTEELLRLGDLHVSKASAEEVFHPRAETEIFENPDDLAAAYRDGKLVSLPRQPAKLGFRPARQLGQHARRLDARRRLYLGLRSEALATLAYMAGQVREITGRKESLVVNSAVRDQRYQDLLIGTEPEATTDYSLHTTGYAFDIWRHYRSSEQETAFTYILNRLRALAVLDYAVEPAAIHITVSDAAKALQPD